MRLPQSHQRPRSNATATNSERSSPVVETLEHRRFAEFCDACTRYRYVGLCFGSPGVGKTVSARHDADRSRDRRTKQTSRGPTVLYTCPVVTSPGRLEREIRNGRSLLRKAAIEEARRREEPRMRRLLQRAEQLRDPQRNPAGYRSDEAVTAEEAFHEQRNRMLQLSSAVADPTALLVIDEADRLKMAGLEQVRDIFDDGGIGLVLIGMPGLEKRLARYPQFYSRIGFVHEFRPLAVTETRRLLEQRWTPPGVRLPDQDLETETAAAIIRITGGNFRLLDRLLTQVERILEINALQSVTKAVVEAARESLVIGQS